MKGDLLVILLLMFVGALLLQGAGAPVMLWVVRAIVSWFEAIPEPGEHLASLIGDLAWPGAALLIAWWLREHISYAASALARRFEKDNVELGGWLKLSADTSLTTLDQRAVTEAPNTVEAEDARIVEGLLEYAGESEENAQRVGNWIRMRYGPTFDPEEFLSEVRFANDRRVAYTELVEGEGNG